MQLIKPREAEISCSPSEPAVRRPNWFLIFYEGLWDYGDYPWTWRHALLLLVALEHLNHWWR
jgi:hypothetical protein